ncbi:MAG: DUF4244 domain-containing protein [Acidimicrobiales bacterium]
MTSIHHPHDRALPVPSADGGRAAPARGPHRDPGSPEGAPPHRPDRRRSERGQATAEYALVMLAAAALAGLLLAWAAGTGGITRLFDAVMGQLIDQVG